MPKSPTAVLVFLLLASRNDLKLGPHMPKSPTAVLVFSLSVFKNDLKLGPHMPKSSRSQSSKTTSN